MDKIETSAANAKWHTLWKKRMLEDKPREGDYNFVVWKGPEGTIVEPWDKAVPPSVFQDGKWVVLANEYGKEN